MHPADRRGARFRGSAAGTQAGCLHRTTTAHRAHPCLPSSLRAACRNSRPAAPSGRLVNSLQVGGSGALAARQRQRQRAAGCRRQATVLAAQTLEAAPRWLAGGWAAPPGPAAPGRAPGPARQLPAQAALLPPSRQQLASNPRRFECWVLPKPSKADNWACPAGASARPPERRRRSASSCVDRTWHAPPSD